VLFEDSFTITIGQYLPTGSLIHQLDARTRIVSFTLLLLAITLSSSLWGLLLGIGFVLSGILLSKVPIRLAVKPVVPMLPFLALLSLLQIFLWREASSPPIFHMGIIQIYTIGILAAIRLLVRFLALIFLLSLASFCISTSEIINGLEMLLKPLTRIGLPTHDVVLIIEVTLNFIPFSAQTIEQVAKAQASRGADWEPVKGNLIHRIRRIIPLIVPLFLISLRRAEHLALAMDARGFRSGVQRTSLNILIFQVRDIIALMIAIGIGTIIILV
jgi:energy-coupling factor transport system permease protein